MEWLRKDVKTGQPEEDKFTGSVTEQSFPYGLWFRGEVAEPDQDPLTPGVFRKTDSKGYLNEPSINSHLESRIIEIYQTQSSFDKLCLAQHHNVPTRLLDWSESILAATFFAVTACENDKDYGKRNAFLYVLNARSLNLESGMGAGRGEIHTPVDFGTKFRAEAA